ncbi:DUF4956 domain-containing protein [Clostridium lacusfryxellense]|uniref:DUF4956 domain-containing protein n=1 Tax=Clostridium lacusfryxellense TaxID=205328 RepID=UPI001C0B8191|nr:DUF4956 domain-containing protein [Clostridium lacusfryxellense]MBU3114069.1 DUF4956 domain-containing protein [Clostridium lacusfryxellense]
MFDSILSSTTAATTITLNDAILTIIVSFILGALISFTYMKTSNKGVYSQNFALTLVIIPTVIAIIVFLVGSNVARAFSLAGALSIIRFRSAPGDSKDISFVLFTTSAGLGVGTGLLGYGILFTTSLCILMFILKLINFGANKSTQNILKITIPEDLDYEGAFDDLFLEYTKGHKLIRVKTTDLGSLFQLIYTVELDNKTSQKGFLDDLRCRNGNLNITLSMCADSAEY